MYTRKFLCVYISNKQCRGAKTSKQTNEKPKPKPKTLTKT